MKLHRYRSKVMPKHPYVPVPGTLQANVRFTCAGQQVENVLCFAYGSGGFDAGAIAAANVISTAWWPAYRVVATKYLQMIEIYLVDLASQSGPVATASPPAPSNGAVDANPAPLSVTLFVSFRTAKRGKSFRGGSFSNGLAATTVESQNILPTPAGQILTAYQDLRAAAASSGVPLVVVSRMTAGAYRPSGLATVVTEVILKDTIIDSQRRRLPGRGQ